AEWGSIPKTQSRDHKLPRRPSAFESGPSLSLAARRSAGVCWEGRREHDNDQDQEGHLREYDRPLPMSAVRRPSAHHATRNEAVMEEHATIKNTPTTPTELLLKGL
ncbi:hypothetical protein THAOC_24171, partial [Thalassiosira oceanica]